MPRRDEAPRRGRRRSRDRGEGRVRPDGGTLGRQRHRSPRTESTDRPRRPVALPRPRPRASHPGGRGDPGDPVGLIAGAEARGRLSLSRPAQRRPVERIRPQIAEDMARRGGECEEREECTGAELVGTVPVQVAEDETAEQLLAVRRRERPAVRYCEPRSSVGQRPTPTRPGLEAVARRRDLVHRGGHAMPMSDPPAPDPASAAAAGLEQLDVGEPHKSKP